MAGTHHAEPIHWPETRPMFATIHGVMPVLMYQLGLSHVMRIHGNGMCLSLIVWLLSSPFTSHRLALVTTEGYQDNIMEPQIRQLNQSMARTIVEAVFVDAAAVLKAMTATTFDEDACPFEIHQHWLWVTALFPHTQAPLPKLIWEAFNLSYYFWDINLAHVWGLIVGWRVCVYYAGTPNPVTLTDLCTSQEMQVHLSKVSRHCLCAFGLVMMINSMLCHSTQCSMNPRLSVRTKSA